MNIKILNIFRSLEEQRFTTCNKQGPIGPEMEDCEKVYKYYKTKVSIGHSDDHDTFAPFGYSTALTPLLTNPKLSSEYLFEDASACLGLRKCAVDNEIEAFA